MTAPVADPWATLPTDWFNPVPPSPATPPLLLLPYDRPIPDWSKEPAISCRPNCAHCHHPEGFGTCRRCVLVCDHCRPLRRPGPDGRLVRVPTDVCITRIRARAEVIPGQGGRFLTVVRDCPYCRSTHIHSAHPDLTPYRISGCTRNRKPYILETRS